MIGAGGNRPVVVKGQRYQLHGRALAHFIPPSAIAQQVLELPLAMIGSSWSPVVVKGPDRLPGMHQSGPRCYASLDIVLWLTA